MDESPLVHPSFFFQAFEDTRICIRKGCTRTVSREKSGVDGLCDACKETAFLARYTTVPRYPRVAKRHLSIFDTKGEYARELHSDPKLNYKKFVEVAKMRKFGTSYSKSCNPNSDMAIHSNIVQPPSRSRVNGMPSSRPGHFNRRRPSANTDVETTPNRYISGPDHSIHNGNPNPTKGRCVGHSAVNRQLSGTKHNPLVLVCALCRSNPAGDWPGQICGLCRVGVVQSDQRVSAGVHSDWGLSTDVPMPVAVIDLAQDSASRHLKHSNGSQIRQPTERPKLKIKLNLNQQNRISSSTNSTSPDPQSIWKIRTAHSPDILDVQQPGNHQPPTLHTIRHLKLCITPDCTGSIQSNSAATRCSECIKSNWKRRRTHNSPISDSPSSSRPSQPPAILKTACDTAKRRKSVTWSETVTEKSADGEIWQRPAAVSGGAIHCRSAEEEIVSSTWEDLDVATNASCAPSGICGWDSELSELTDDDEVKHKETSAPTGLKIRLPPHPNAIRSRPCGNQKCRQVLEEDYRWKTCVLCRARSRDYQRKRQKIENGHQRLDNELLGHHIQAWNTRSLDTIPPDISQTISVISRPVGVVLKSRLCSISNCPHVLAPVDEYPSDKCSLCHLRGMVQNASPESSPDGPSSKRLLQSMILLPDGQPLEGRCLSQDCGFVLRPNSLCRQCVARRLVLVRLARMAVNGQDLSRSPPLESRSYPQFKCLTHLLDDFASRLSGFQRVQSVFYLTKASDPNFVDVKTMFSFDGEYSVVAIDSNILERKAEVDVQALLHKKEFERLGKIRFIPKRLVSVLENGGISVRFVCQHRAPVLEAVKENDDVSVRIAHKIMHGELEIATLPDQSHCFLPGQKTIIRFRMLG